MISTPMIGQALIHKNGHLFKSPQQPSWEMLSDPSVQLGGGGSEKLSPVLARVGGPEPGSRGLRLDHSRLRDGKSYASL